MVTNTATIGSLTYKSETSNGFEVGYKAELLNRRLSLDLNAYRYNYGNLQRDILNPTTVTFLIQNAAAALIEGVEAKAQFAVTSDFGLWTDATYNNAKYTSYANAPCYAGQTVAQGCAGPNYSSGVQNLTGDTLYLAPKWDIDTGFTFQHQVDGDWKVALDADVEYNSGYATSDLHNPIDLQHKYYRLNADIRVFDSRHWTFALVGRDINDALVVLGASSAVLGLPGDETGTIARPAAGHARGKATASENRNGAFAKFRSPSLKGPGEIHGINISPDSAHQGRRRKPAFAGRRQGRQPGRTGPSQSARTAVVLRHDQGL